MKSCMISLVIILLFLSLASCEDPVKEKWEPRKVNSDSLDFVWKIPRDEKFILNGGSSGYQQTLIKIEGDFLYVCSDNAIRKYNKITQELIWENPIKPYLGTQTASFTHMGSLILENGRIFLIASANVYCFSTDNGNLVWEVDLEPINTALEHGELCHSADKIFVGCRSSQNKFPAKVVDISKSSGSILWRTKNDVIDVDYNRTFVGISPPSYSASNNRVYFSTLLRGVDVGGSTGTIVALDANTGEKIFEKYLQYYTKEETKDWAACHRFFNFDDGRPVGNRSQIQIYNDKLIYRDQIVCQADLELNLIKRKRMYHNEIYNSAGIRVNPVIVGDMFVYYGYGNRAYGFGIDANTLEQVWSIDLVETANFGDKTINNYSIYVEGNKTYIVTDDGWLFGNDAYTGQLLWSSSLPMQTYIDDDGIRKGTGYMGPYAVEGDYVYYNGSRYLFCYKRHKNS